MVMIEIQNLPSCLHRDVKNIQHCIERETYETRVNMCTECRLALFAIQASSACNVERHDYSIPDIEELSENDGFIDMLERSECK